MTISYPKKEQTLDRQLPHKDCCEDDEQMIDLKLEIANGEEKEHRRNLKSAYYHVEIF